MYRNEQLSYYQKNAIEAYNLGFTTKLHYEHIEDTGEIYEVHKYYIPCSIANKVKWLKWYFKNITEDGTPFTHRRHKHWVEYAETSLLMLLRIYHSISRDSTILAGSQSVCPIPWAIFGPRMKMARHHFGRIADIPKYYHNQLHGICYPIDVHFRIGSDWAHKIAIKFDKRPYNSPNFWMASALLLTYDLIHNGGPDGAAEFFELFVNDYRISQQHFNLKFWEQERPELLGVAKKYQIPSLYAERYGIRNIEPYEERKPMRVKTHIELISEGSDLLANEKTYPTKIKVERSHSNIFKHSAASFGDYMKDAVKNSTNGLGLRSFKLGGKTFGADTIFGNGCTPDMM